MINKQIQKIKDDITYGVDSMESLHYARGKLSALEVLLQDLNDLLKRGDIDDDTNN
tara:strand:+ start:653 stop:820 length:168 start_codon:yes stop_codon:yes gene_type:complete